MHITQGGAVIIDPVDNIVLKKHKKAVIEDVRKSSVEEVPMIWFIPIEGNKEFMNWINESIQQV